MRVSGEVHDVAQRARAPTGHGLDPLGRYSGYLYLLHVVGTIEYLEAKLPFKNQADPGVRLFGLELQRLTPGRTVLHRN